MKKKILVISISLVLFLIYISGCIEETPPDDKTNIVENLKMIYVDDDGGADYTKIQDAIDHVADGGTIFVRNGTYHEILIIDKSINLIGEDSDNTIIDYKIGSITNSDSVILISGNNCTLNRFNITYRYYISDIIGIKITSSNNTISNNTISYTYKSIYLDTYSKNNTITWNTISDTRHGVSTYGSDSSNISKNNISACKTYGIYLYGSDNNIISGNTISDSEGIGIRLQGSKNSEIFENTIKNCSQGVRFCCGAKSNIVYYNVFKQNRDWNAEDEVTNQWDNGSVGNYWDDYLERYPNATQLNGVWDTPYKITGDNNIDRFPLVNPVDI